MLPERDTAQTLSADKARGMRRTATGLLIAMALAFIALRHFEGAHPGWGYAIAFTEAAMVGGLADWFAVTALFRHPLGIPIPHTAIIPVNKNRIADTMAVFLRENFLTPQVVARRLQGFNLAEGAGKFLCADRPDSGGRLQDGVAELFADILESLDPERLGGQVRTGLTHQLEKLEVAPLLGQMLQTSIADERHTPLLDSLIRKAGEVLEANDDLMRTIVRQRTSAILQWTGLDGRIAISVLDGLYKLLAEMLVIPGHPLRMKIEELLETLAVDLVEDADTREKVERAKLELLANPALGHWWQGVWERIRMGLIEAARDPQRPVSAHLDSALTELGTALREDKALQVQVNRFARRAMVGVVSRYGDEIVRLVSETVKRWDAQTVTGRIESAVGRDLQFIRINGTLVGGLVGLAIHAVDSIL